MNRASEYNSFNCRVHCTAWQNVGTPCQAEILADCVGCCLLPWKKGQYFLSLKRATKSITRNWFLGGSSRPQSREPSARLSDEHEDSRLWVLQLLQAGGRPPDHLVRVPSLRCTRGLWGQSLQGARSRCLGETIHLLSASTTFKARARATIFKVCKRITVICIFFWTMEQIFIPLEMFFSFWIKMFLLYVT